MDYDWFDEDYILDEIDREHQEYESRKDALRVRVERFKNYIQNHTEISQRYLLSEIDGIYEQAKELMR